MSAGDERTDPLGPPDSASSAGIPFRAARYWRTGQPVFILLAFGAVAYSNAFRGVFHFDDVASIGGDSRLTDFPTFLSHVTGMIRPVLKLTLLVDRRLWGTSPAGYHFINLWLHAGSGLLLYAILARLVNDATRRDGAVPATSLPLWAALLFLVHPLGTETVTYVSGRATGLMAFWYLAALYLYLRASEPANLARAFPGAQLGAIGCFVLALLSKESAVTFPAALLLTEVVARQTRGDALRTVFLRRHSIFWGILLLLFAAASIHPRYGMFADILRIRPLDDNLLAQVKVVAYALTLFVAPGRLNFDHEFPSFGHSFFAWPTPIAIAALIGLMAAAAARARTHPLFAFGIFWFFLQLMPTNSVLPRDDLLSERNLYLPAAGLFLAVASAWCALVGWLAASSRDRRVNRASNAARVLPFALAIVLVVATFARNSIYSDPIALWSDAVQKSPTKARPHINLGHAYYLTGDLDRATEQFRIGLALDPDNPIAQANLRAIWDLSSRTRR